MFYVSSDDRTNTVLVTGPADKIASARQIVTKIDVPQKGQLPLPVGPHEFRNYSVAGGNAEAVAKTLQDIYKPSTNTRISAVGNSSILAYASPAEHFEIAKHINAAKEQGGGTEVIPLNTLDAAWVVEKLKGMFGGDKKTGSAFIDSDLTRNAVIVNGTAEQMGEVRAALKALGEGGGAPVGGTTRIITLPQGSAAALAEAIQRMMEQMRPETPVKVITPEGEKKPESQKKPETAPPAKSNDKDTSASLGEQGDFIRVGQQLVDPQAQKKTTPPAKGPPVTITAVGNKLIVNSDDPKALAMVSELVRLLTTSPGPEGPFEIIRLKNASAVDAAKILDEAYNGNKPQNNQQQQGFPFFGGRFQPPAQPVPNRIRVVADPGSNSLLVRASPLDMLDIRRVLKEAIDSGETDSKAIIKTHPLIKMTHASATEVANVIRDVYRESMNNNPINVGFGGGFGGFGPFGGGRFRGGQPVQNVDANGNPRGVSLSVGVDDRSNSLIVSCSDAMFKDVKKLAEELDKAAANATRTVRVVSVKGIDPLLVQQAIDAIQGRRTTSPFNTRPGMGPQGTGGGFGGPGNFGGFGGGRGFGGGFGGGGGGFGGGGGPPRSSYSGPQSRGPDFFEERVTDDPQPTFLYDPQQPINDAENENPASGRGRVSQTELNSDSSNTSNPIQLTSYQEEQQPGGGPTGPVAPGAGANVQGPRSPVTAEALEQLGIVVVSGNTPADVEEVVRIIELITKLGAGSEVEIRVVPLAVADATSVANTLTQLFNRVNLTATGNVAVSSTSTIRPTTPTPAFPGAAGQITPQATALPQGTGPVVLFSLPRFNAILAAAPKARIEDVVKEIKRLDQPNASQARAVSFPLRKASASRVSTLIQSFYATRYPNNVDQVRISHEDSTNTVLVQAAPGDLAEIRSLIESIDSTVSPAVNDVRIIGLRFATADELANLLNTAISLGTIAPSPTAAPTVGPTLPGGPAAPGGPLATLAARAATAATTATTGGTSTKATTLRFLSGRPGVTGPVQSGLLDDIHVISEARLNALLLLAPPETMNLLLALIRDLDVPPPNLADIKVFTLRKADAAATANSLQQLFLGTAGTTGTGGAPGGAPGGGPTAAPTAVLPTVSAAAVPRAQFTLGPLTPEGAPLVPLGITVDARTNSLIVAGARNDLAVIEVLVSRIEDSEAPVRRDEVFHLRNAAAADVATALSTFLTNKLLVLSRAGQFNAYAEITRDVVVVAEPISNKLLVSATPEYFVDINRIIDELDAQPPQVVIQVLIAEVDLNNTEEFGVEIGLQNPVLFSRSIIPATSFVGTNGTITYTTPTTGTGLVPPGVTVNSSINPAAQPGFLFNNPALPLGNNPVVNPGIVGIQGLGSFGTGRQDANGLSGFVFSAASDTFNLLIRALKTQGRIDMLSRPQIQTLDNQAATINVGQDIPYVTASNVTGTGIISNSIAYRSVGVILTVTPRISPDGTVLMRVIPEVSSVAATQTPLGNGQTATAFNVQHIETTALAQDGETVVVGGLITKVDKKSENKIPWLGDLPYLGALFRYRTQAKNKSELLVILTPHIVRNRLEADRVLAQESRRMDWVIGDVLKIHDTTGMEPVLPPPKGQPPARIQAAPSPLYDLHTPESFVAPNFAPPGMPAPGLVVPPSARPLPPGGPQESLPQPRVLPGPAGQGQAPVGTPPVVMTNPAVPMQTNAPDASATPPACATAAPMDPPKEEKSRIWKFFHRDQ
jgi:type II secretory pathway component GspD/PulD (secretin)